MADEGQGAVDLQLGQAVPADLRLLMGTVVRAGSGADVVGATGGHGLGQRQPGTEFQVGLRRFSMLPVRVVGGLTGGIFIINGALYKPVLSALLFSLAIAVGITSQLLPAVDPTLTPFPGRRCSANWMAKGGSSRRSCQHPSSRPSHDIWPVHAGAFAPSRPHRHHAA